MSAITAVTLNINGARDHRKRAIVYELVRHKRADVVFLQETRSDAGNSSWSGRYAYNVTKDITRSLRALEIEVVELQGLVESTGNRVHIEALKKKKHALDDLLDTTVQGRCSTRALKAQQRYSGELVTDPAEIRKQTVSFYSKLYRSELEAVQEVEEDFVRNLTEELARELDRELILEELEVALNSMQNGRSPGIDGLPVEFFKAF
ncbi:hypothetical protein QTP86_018464, partial [Hemibagrus guttatus]